jgi:SP family facilitated glucose transporter-like MFS transporter 8
MCFAANVITLAYGVVPGWPSPTLPLLRSKETALGGHPVTQEEESWLASLPFLGAFLFSPAYSYINQNLGRKAAGYLSAVPAIIAYLLIIFGDSIVYLLIARFILGLCIAGVNIFTTTYVSEISEDSIRGALGNFRGIAAGAGTITVYAVGSYLSVQNTGIVCLSIPILFLFGYFWLPESPVFSLGKGRRTEAFRTYSWLRGDAGLAEMEVTKLEAVVSVGAPETRKVSILDLMSVRGTRRALLIALVLSVVQQFSGMNVVYGYCESIFEMSQSNISPQISSIIFGFVNLSGSLFSCFSSDLAGRRPILICTQIFQGFCLVGLGIYMYTHSLGIDVSVVGVIPIICISLYSFCVIAGPADLLFVVMAEIFRPEARGLAMGITSSTIWMLVFISTKFYELLVGLLGVHGCFWMFSGFSFIGAVFTFFQLPETKNRSLESILRELNGDPPLENGRDI